MLTAIYCLGTVDLVQIVSGQRSVALVYALLPMAILFAVSVVAETNRAPFDLPEAESELVAGFFTEHSAISFAYFFLGEYANILTMSTLLGILFFGSPKFMIALILMIWLRASLSRLRFDQLLVVG